MAVRETKARNHTENYLSYLMCPRVSAWIKEYLTGNQGYKFASANIACLAYEELEMQWAPTKDLLKHLLFNSKGEESHAPSSTLKQPEKLP